MWKKLTSTVVEFISIGMNIRVPTDRCDQVAGISMFCGEERDDEETPSLSAALRRHLRGKWGRDKEGFWWCGPWLWGQRYKLFPALDRTLTVSIPSLHTALCSLTLFCGLRGWDQFSTWGEDKMDGEIHRQWHRVWPDMDGKQLEVSGNKREKVTTRRKPSPQLRTFRDTPRDGTKLAAVVEEKDSIKLFCLEIKEDHDSQAL